MAERLDTIPSRLLGRCSVVAERISSTHLAPMTKWQYATLVTLRGGGQASQAELSRRTGVHRGDMVAVINELAEAGYVERAVDPDDRRRNVVTLTRAGRARLRGLDRRVDEAQDELLAPLDANERAELVRLLRKINAHHSRVGSPSWSSGD